MKHGSGRCGDGEAMSVILSASEEAAIATFRANPRLILLRSDSFQHYPWGDPEFIPALLGIENPSRKPYAELWLGAHPELPSQVDLGDARVPLDALIAGASVEVLGRETAQRFSGELPYLLKVLSAGTPLSIQAHPSKAQAEAGYAREHAAGIPLSARHRSYKDDNHKPELIVAVTDFFALRGFRPFSEIARILREVPEFRRWQEFRETSAGLRSLFEEIMNLSEPEVDALLEPVVKRLRAAHESEPFTRDDREYWVLRADREFSRGGHRDRGLFSIYLLNLIHLRPGEAMYLPSGILHAHLRGACVELMANSNNVLRGGLTGKHRDVAELVRTLTFEGEDPRIVTAAPITGTSEWRYETPAHEFELRRITLARAGHHKNEAEPSVQIVVLIECEDGARVTVASAGRALDLRRGSSFLVPAGLDYTIESPVHATLFKATLPVSSVETVEVSTDHPRFRGRVPTPLAFGTSGLRGLVTDITDLEAYINTTGFLEYLFETATIAKNDIVCIAGDLRPSTDEPERSILRAVARGIQDRGLEVENLGKIPTPALTAYAIQEGRASVMVTGSHIPFDRNGIKFNRTDGEVLKADEAGILASVARARRREYSLPADPSLFRDDGMFRDATAGSLPPVHDHARRAYRRRYLEFFPERCLRGRRVVFFQHSAVGRDLLVELLADLGAEVFPAGRSESFVPIDTEAITSEKLAELQKMVNDEVKRNGPIDALLSTDGDSDRPLVVGVDAAGQARFFGGDLLGTVVAEYLDVDSVTVPVSANDAVDRHCAARGITPIKTKIGSPHVIEGMREAVASGKRRVVGWEANGGFLTGSTLRLGDRALSALPTRDAALPLLAALHACVMSQSSLTALFSRLPPRFSRAGLLDEVSPETSRAVLARFSPPDRVNEVRFEKGRARLIAQDGTSEEVSGGVLTGLHAIRRDLEAHFTPQLGFGDVVGLNAIDGLRIYFANGDIAHIRPSGNAPQLRIYAVANTQARADEIVASGIREPDGLLRGLAESVTGV